MVYRRYASLFFIAGCSSTDNELITLEIVHRYVEQMDKYYGNVCELDIIFNFQKAYFILDELLLAGELQESSKKNVLRCIGQQDSLEDLEVSVKLVFFPPFLADAFLALYAPRPSLLPVFGPARSSPTGHTYQIVARAVFAARRQRKTMFCFSFLDAPVLWT